MQSRTLRLAGSALVCLVLGLLPVSLAQAGKGPFRYRLVGHIGGSGTGHGRFSGEGPGGIAIDQECGNVYISDYGAQVVHRYDQNGRFLNDVGAPGTGRGELGRPAGLFVQQTVTPVNPDGPPPSCGSSGAVWVADSSDGRIDSFEPNGSVSSMWCNNDLQNLGCDIVRSHGADGFDFYPNDVWVTDHNVFVAGRLTNEIDEYDMSGGLVRASDSTSNSAFSVAVAGASIWSTYGGNGHTNLGLYSGNPMDPTIRLVHGFGGPYGDTPGLFENVSGVWAQTDGTLYVVDGDRVQVFSPSGRYRSTIRLPPDFRGNDVAVRYDGTVYVTGENGHGANVYSPGPVVTMFVDQTKHGNDVRLHGRVKPSHAGDRIVLQRVAGNGFRTIATVRLDRRSRFTYTWHPPAVGREYAARAFFHDPHRYHADRASRLGQIHVLSRLP
jgi:hypothetical protein